MPSAALPCALISPGGRGRAQPNILDEYSKERGLAPSVSAAKLTGPEDLLILEDEKARMVLRGDQLPIASRVTGKRTRREGDEP